MAAVATPAAPASNGANGANGEQPTTSSTEQTSPQLPALDGLLKKSVVRTRALFTYNDPLLLSEGAGADSSKARIASKIESEYRDLLTLPAALQAQQAGARLAGPAAPAPAAGPQGVKRKLIEGPEVASAGSAVIDDVASNKALVRQQQQHAAHAQPTLLSQSLIKRKEARSVKPDYHPQWKLSRVISGHLGWVRCVAVEPGNQWFATGAGDRVIKIWDLATGELKLSLTGHISTVRGLAVSNRHPYLFSAGEDKMVKCWDLEQNKVIRHYHGHLSAVYSLALHPTLDLLVTAGRDASARVWDMRTKAGIHVLTGHTATVADVQCQESDPQIITGSMDSTIRLWDIVAGKTMSQLTHHHKSVRSLTIHPTEFSFASGSAGGNNIKKWKFPEGSFVHNFAGHEAIVNSVNVNQDGVFYSGGDDGSQVFWDYKTGLPFQTIQDKPQPGSLDAEAGVFASSFDVTGSRLITGNADKTIKIYSET